MKLSKKLIVFGVTLSLSMPLLAGSLDSPALPSDDSSRMYTLEDIYNRLDTGAEAATPSSGFTEPTSGPTATGKTLTEVYNKAEAVSNLEMRAFEGVQATIPYCSSTTFAGDPALAWFVFLDSGNVLYDGKYNAAYVWPVRGGQ